MWAYHKNDGPAKAPPTTKEKELKFPGKTSTHTGRDGGSWRERHPNTPPRLALMFWSAFEEMEQVCAPINTWKDQERDETVYTPRLIVVEGPVTRALADGEVLYQSRRYTNPLIMRADRDERE